MLVTRESDYAIRVVRMLSTCEKAPVSKICEVEHVPFQFAYKILKKLEKASLVKSYRGVNGGYSLLKPVGEITLYDVLCAIDDKLLIIHCLQDDFICANTEPGKPCKINEEMRRLQDVFEAELKSKPLTELFEN